MSNQIKKEFSRKTEPVRLNKYLSEAGVCSRREADKLIVKRPSERGRETRAYRYEDRSGTESESGK